MFENDTIFIAPGDVIVKQNTFSLASTPLGSCIAAVAYHEISGTGGMAHIMMPGKAPKFCKKNQCRYAENALELLLEKYAKLGIDNNQLVFVLIGGANVLKRSKESLTSEIISSVEGIFKEKKLNLITSSLGGTKRRSVSIKNNGEVLYSVGNKKSQLLTNLKRKY